MTMTTNLPPSQFQRPQRYQPERYQPQRDRNVEAPRRRSVRFGAIVVTIIIIAVAVIGFGSDVAASSDVAGLEAAGSDAIELYIVQPGDTLWDIASTIALPGEDVRPLIDELRALAGGSALEVGQRLVIDLSLIHI